MKRLGLLLLIGLLVFASSTIIQAQDDTELERVDQAMAHLSEYLGTTINRNSNFWRWQQLYFDNASLGCPAVGETYAQGQVLGYQVTITANNTDWDYRMTADGSTLVLCGGDGTPLYRSDATQPFQVTVQPAPATTSSQNVPPAAWYSWLYLESNDTLYLVGPNGTVAELQRPQLPGEQAGASPHLAISPNGVYLIEVMPLNSGVEALGIYNITTGTLINTISAAADEEIYIGWGQEGLVAGSTFIFNPTSTRVAVGFGNPSVNSWRIAVIDLATGSVTTQMREIDLGVLVNNPDQALLNVLQGQGMYFPRPVYFDSNGGVHVQLIRAFTEGAANYPAFVWYPDTSSGAVSPYTYASIDILPPSGTALFAWQDPNVTALEPMGPYQVNNAIAQGMPGGTSFVPQNIYRNSNFAFWRPQWADNGQKVVFVMEDLVNPSQWAMFDPAAPLVAPFLPDMLPAFVELATGVPGGALVVDASDVLYFLTDSSTYQQVWSPPAGQANMSIIWVQPENTTFELNSIAASQSGDSSDTTPPVDPSGGTTTCVGVVSPRLTTGMHARVTFTDGTPLRLRATPGGEFLRDMAEGTEFDILAGPVCQSSFNWYQVQLNNGTSGWAAEGDNDTYFIEPYNPGSNPTIVPGGPSGGTSGTYTATFQETEMVNVAYGPTLGGQHFCRPHNITINNADVGKAIRVEMTSWDISYPNYYTQLPIWVTLYQSYVGPWAAEQSIDLYSSPQAENLAGQRGWTWFTFTVAEAGQYVACIEMDANTFYDPEVTLNSVQYTVSIQ